MSLAALLGALVLLYRLTALELGRRAAAPAVLLLCVFPASLFLGAPYSESLFLLCSVGAFYAARTGHWAWAGAAAASASATRSAGLLLLLPLVLIYLYGPRADRPASRAALRPPGWMGVAAPGPRGCGATPRWLALAPLGLVAYAAWLGFAHGDPLAFSGAQDFWGREFAGPAGGRVGRARRRRSMARASCCRAPRETVYFERAGGDPMRVAADEPDAVRLPGLRRSSPRSACCAGCRSPTAPTWSAALMLPLSYPVGPQPLMSLPRFLLVLFPIFMWLARGRPRSAARPRARPPPRPIGPGAAHHAVRRLALHRLMAVRAVLLDALGTLVELAAARAAPAGAAARS